MTRARTAKRRACIGKQALTKPQALTLVVQLRLKDTARMDAYRCPNGCRLPGPKGSEPRAWHVGHKRLGGWLR